MLENSENKKTFSDYLYVLYKWKKLIFINMLIVIILTTIWSFLIPETFKSTARVTLSGQQSGGLSGLSNLLNSNPAASFGAQFLGISSSSQDMVLALLNSRTILTEVINKFDLMKYYEIDDNNMDKALKAFENDVSFEPNENGLIEISAINEDPKLAADIANYFVQLADSMNIELNIEQAKSNKDFIAKRYEKNVNDLKAAEDSMYRFQKKYGVYAIPEQLVSAFQAAGDLEAELLKQKLAAEYAKNQYGENSTQYKTLSNQINFIESKIGELKNSKTLPYPTNVLVPFGNLPKMMEDYFRFYREIEIQTKIMEFILPMYEQAKVEEQKSVPTLIVVDKAVPAELKYRPKKAFIILGISLLVFFILIVFVFHGDKVINESEDRNPLVLKEKKFFQRIIHFYRLKF